MAIHGNNKILSLLDKEAIFEYKTLPDEWKGGNGFKDEKSFEIMKTEDPADTTIREGEPRSYLCKLLVCPELRVGCDVEPVCRESR